MNKNKKQKQSHRQKRKGFNLIEVLLVITIIGIMATIAVPSYFQSLGKGKDAERLSNVQTMSRIVLLRANAIENFTYGYNRAGLKEIMDRQNVEMPTSGALGCYVFGVSSDEANYFFAIESSAEPNNFIVDGSIGGKAAFSADLGLKLQMTTCSVLTDPTIDQNYRVFYL